MKILVAYDTVHGNTEQIALAIGKALGTKNEVEIIKTDEVNQNHVADIDLLVVGSPTHGGRFTKAIQELFKKSFLPVEGI